jgi:hypothetical protein
VESFLGCKYMEDSFVSLSMSPHTRGYITHLSSCIPELATLLLIDPDTPLILAPPLMLDLVPRLETYLQSRGTCFMDRH